MQHASAGKPDVYHVGTRVCLYTNTKSTLEIYEYFPWKTRNI